MLNILLTSPTLSLMAAEVILPFSINGSPTAPSVSRDIPMESGKSRFMITGSMGSGCIIAQMPSTPRRLNIFEPVTLLRAISFAPLSAAEVLTASSGALVPIATIVRPMITPGTLKFFARAELPSTKKSAPLIRARKPTASRSIFKNSSIFIHFPLF